MSNSKRKSHCNKKKYDSLLAAQIGAKRTFQNTRRRDDPIVTKLSGYKCSYCNGFHVGRSRNAGINWDAIADHETKLRSRMTSWNKI